MEERDVEECGEVDLLERHVADVALEHLEHVEVAAVVLVEVVDGVLHEGVDFCLCERSGPAGLARRFWLGGTR